MKKEKRSTCPCTTNLSKMEFLERSRARPFFVAFNLAGRDERIRRLTGSPKNRILSVKVTSGQVNYNRRGRGRAEFFGFVDGFHHKPVSFTISLDTLPMPKGSIEFMHKEIAQ